jgi:hypothetical protein
VTGAEEHALDVRDRAMRLAIQVAGQWQPPPPLNGIIRDARRIEQYLETGE